MPALPEQTKENRVKPMLVAGTESYIAQFEKHQANLPGLNHDWIRVRRQTSLDNFGRTGFPTQRHEDWRYTPLKPVTSKEYQLTDSAESMTADELRSALKSITIEDFDGYRIVFVDGALVEIDSKLQSLSPEMRILPLSKALDEMPEILEKHYGQLVPDQHHGFTSLNGAMHQDGYVLIAAANTKLEKPLELVFVNHQQSALAMPRNLIVMHENAKASVVERFVSSANESVLSNGVSEIILRQSAELDYFLVQQQDRSAHQVCSVWADQAQDSRFSCHTITLGGGVVRNDLRVSLSGSGAHCDMFGVYSLSGRQHVDNHTTVIHAEPECTSNELYKGVLDKRSRGVFHGRIKVEQDAQKTDAQQANNTLLLSRDAEIDTKPQLEIYADDVKCSHGATVGELDETSLFYLRSRGIDMEAARSMLTYAFVNEVLSEISIEPLRAYLEKMLGEQLIDEEQIEQIEL